MTATPTQPTAPAGPLVTADWLEAHLADPGLRILDVRGRHPSSPLPHAKRAEYERAHIPGAIFVDWERDFIDTDDPVAYQVASADRFADRAGKLGISDKHLVVTLDDYFSIFAARTAWAFRLHGVEARVLDGGWPSWRDDNRPTTNSVSNHATEEFTPRMRPRLRRTLEDVTAARERGATLVDARPLHLFVGEKGTPGTGHIPGAVSLPYFELVDGATGAWASPAAISRLLRGVGIDPAHPPNELIASCGTGVSATVALMALELAGVHGTGVYDGSFTEWSRDPERPVEYGPVH
jgi:thiosulfate/3-mercaptopyruvate sulfurtransferase